MIRLNGLVGHLLLSLSLCVSFSTMTAAQELVTVGLVSPNAVGTSGPITFARELGWLKEEGIEVRFIEFNGSATMLPQLAGKRITLGWPNPDPLISSHDTGKDPLPIRMFYNVFRNSVWEFAVLENSPIRQLTDLKGKKVGVLGMTSGNIPITKAQFRELGMQVGRDVDLVPVGAGAPVSVALTSGRIDAVNHYSAQLILMEQQGLKLRRLHQLPRYADLFSNGFAAHNDTIASRGELLGKFGRVYAKGEIACYANLPDCIRSFWRAYPEKKPNNDLGEEKNLANAISAMEDSRDMIMSFAPGEPHQLGWYNRQIWTNFIQILHEGGQISTTAIDPDKLYTNSLVESMNKFSVADVEKMAKMLNSSRR